MFLVDVWIHGKVDKWKGIDGWMEVWKEYREAAWN